MTDLHFPCPSCGEQLTFKQSFAGRDAECPYCYATISVPEDESQVTSEVPTDTSYFAPTQMGGSLSFVCFFLCILGPFFSFVFALVSTLSAVLPHTSSNPHLQERMVETLLHAIQAVVFLLWGVQSFRAGYRLWRMQPLAVHKARRFLHLAVVYAIVEDILFVRILNAGAHSQSSLGFTIFSFFFGLAWFVTPVLLLLLYLHSSQRVRATFPDEFPPERASQQVSAP